MDSAKDYGKSDSEKSGVQHRPLGFFMEQNVFVICIWAVEKDGKFVPKSACQTALARKAEILADRTRCHDCWLALH